MYKIVFTKQAVKDYEKVRTSNLKAKAGQILKTISENPYKKPLEKLTDKENTYSKRLNVQHRIVYEIFDQEQTVKIIRMWTHYGE